MKITANHQNTNGFTLVEIMVCVLIISILMAIALPNFLRSREKSRARLCQTNLRAIMSAKDQWAMDNKKKESDTPTESQIAGQYIKSPTGKLPECPSGGRYTIGNVGTSPICSIGTNSDANAYDDHVYISVGG